LVLTVRILFLSPFARSCEKISRQDAPGATIRNPVNLQDYRFGCSSSAFMPVSLVGQVGLRSDFTRSVMPYLKEVLTRYLFLIIHDQFIRH
jgi:hypothetical protein